MSVDDQYLTPNTLIQSSMLSEKVILCCGEDPTVVREALHAIGLRISLLEHDFRCYRLIRFEGLTVILAAIGTGHLEPLLFEILRFNVVRVVVLVGTAGRTASSKTIIGQPYVINKAYLKGTALDREVNDGPLSPNYHVESEYEVASIVSTDFYYGFTLSKERNDYPNRLPRLQEDVKEIIAKVDLVDMEVGQFFALCRLMSPERRLKYLAIKGPANTLGSGKEQNIHAKEVLTRVFQKTVDILGIRIPGPQDNLSSGHQESSPSAAKLTEEVKLYWTIQTAIVSVLGFLSASIDFGRPEKSAAVIVCAILLMGIGAIYNLVGNYYAYHEGEDLRVQHQENIVTPSVAVIYGVVAPFLGLLLGYALLKVVSKHLLTCISTWTQVLLPLGTAIGVFSVLVFVLRHVYKKLLEKGSPGYKNYSRPLQTILRVRGWDSTS